LGLNNGKKEQLTSYSLSAICFVNVEIIGVDVYFLVESSGVEADYSFILLILVYDGYHRRMTRPVVESCPYSYELLG
jgi:hypothetical protein